MCGKKATSERTTKSASSGRRRCRWGRRSHSHSRSRSRCDTRSGPDEGQGHLRVEMPEKEREIERTLRTLFHMLPSRPPVKNPVQNPGPLSLRTIVSTQHPSVRLGETAWGVPRRGRRRRRITRGAVARAMARAVAVIARSSAIATTSARRCRVRETHTESTSQ
jgi:hypothetical protein